MIGQNIGAEPNECGRSEWKLSIFSADSQIWADQVSIYWTLAYFQLTSMSDNKLMQNLQNLKYIWFWHTFQWQLQKWTLTHVTFWSFQMTSSKPTLTFCVSMTFQHLWLVGNVTHGLWWQFLTLLAHQNNSTLAITVKVHCYFCHCFWLLFTVVLISIIYEKRCYHWPLWKISHTDTSLSSAMNLVVEETKPY